jgi:hypothetical protein
MIMNIRIGIGLLAVLLLALATPSKTKADERDQATLFNFSTAVRVPGQVLPAGSYWFALMDRGAYPQTVQIFRADEMALVATIHAASALRDEATGTTRLTLAEPGSDSRSAVPAITKWFYPGDEVGHEFIYSDWREKQLQRERERELRVPFEPATRAAMPSIAVP